MSTTYENFADQREVPTWGMADSFSDAYSPKASTSGWTLTKDAAITLYTELRLQLSMPPFANQMKSLLDKGHTRDVGEERLKLIRMAEQNAISLLNSESTDEEVKVLRKVCKSWRSDSDVGLLHKAICRDFHIDAFGDNPDVELADLGKHIARLDIRETIPHPEPIRESFDSPQFQTNARCAEVEEVPRSACGAKEIAEKTAEKAAQDTVEEVPWSACGAEEIATNNVEKQNNSPRVAAVLRCCRG